MHHSVTAVAILLAACAFARAETGPCKPDEFKGLVCGEGIGSARVIEGTTSPSGRLAFAWRSKSSAPHDLLTDREHYDLESLLIRLTDGAVLAAGKGEFWDTGEVHVNRHETHVAWSPDSRFAVEVQDFRWWTPALRAYAIGAGDKILALDLKAIIEPATRKYLTKSGEKEEQFYFAIFGIYNGEPPHITIDNRGLIKAVVMMEIPRPETSYVMLDVTAKVIARDGTLTVRDITIRDSKVEP